MEQMTNELFMKLNQEFKNKKDHFITINNNNQATNQKQNSETSVPTKIKRKKSFDFSSFSNPIVFQEFFEQESYLQSPNNILVSLLTHYRIPSQYDQKFVEFLKTKSDLKLIELYCLKNSNEDTIFLIINEILGLLGLNREVDKFASDNYTSFEKKVKREYQQIDSKSLKKLYFMRLVLTKKM